MAQLNTLVVKVMGDIKDVQAKLKKLDKRVATTNKKITKFTKGIKDGIGKFVKYAAAISVTIIAVRKMTRFITSSIQAYNEQVLSLTKLESTLKSTGRFTLETRDKMVEFANEMQRTTGISDTLVLSAEAIMTTFTQISTETFPEAITLAADMSKLFGQDLQQTVIQLGTALNDPIAGVGRLKRIGISFTEDQRESIKQFVAQNDVMSAQRVILDELQVEIGGTAVAMGQTMAGQMDVLKNSFTDMKEEIGFLTEGSLPTLILLSQNMVTIFTNFIAKFNESKRLLKEHSEQLAEKTVEELKLAISWQDAHTRSLNKTLLPLRDNIEELEKLEKRNRDQRKTLRDLKKQYDALNPTYRDAIAVLTELTTALEVAEEKEKKLKEGVEENEPPIEEQELDVSTLSDAWSRYADNMENAIDKNIKMKENVDILNTGLDEQQTAIREWGRSIQDQTGTAIEDYDKFIEKMKEVAEESELTAQQFFAAWDQSLNAVTGVFDQFFKNQLLMAEGNEKKIKEIIRNQAIAEKAFGIFKTIIDTIQGVARALKDYPWPFSLVVGSIVAAAGAVQTGLIIAQPLPALAEGGVAIRDTLAQIGEAEPEAVIPLTSDALKPFAQAIVGEIGKLQTPLAPYFAMGGTVVNVKIGNEPIIAAVQRAFDNKQLRANVKTIR